MKKLSTTAILGFVIFVLSCVFYVMFLQSQPSVAYAQAATAEVAFSQADAYDFEQITVSTNAIGFTSSKLSSPGVPSAKAAILTVETNPLRYRYDGTADPTSTVGHLRAATDPPMVVYGINNLRKFKMIRSGGADATVFVTYLR